MVKQENLAANFCGMLVSQGFKDKAIEWRVLGQEQDGSLLLSWVFINTFTNDQNTCIGQYSDKLFRILYEFHKRENVIQASVNKTVTLIAFVTKCSIVSKTVTEKEMCNIFTYQPYVVVIKRSHSIPIKLYPKALMTQAMVQFLWNNYPSSEKICEDKLLLLIHKEMICLYTCIANYKCQNDDGMSNCSDIVEEWFLDIDLSSREVLSKNFTWAQWDSENQSLFYIHTKPKANKISSNENTNEDIEEYCSTLSAFQFNTQLPTETVLNIPLNLPKLPPTSKDIQHVYEDDTVPMRIHDSSLNLIIMTDISGMLFVCHYYLYHSNKPVIGHTSQENVDVNFAYSVTILHHGCVIHCVMPGIPFEKAKKLRPTFALYGDHHLIVLQPDLFVHLLDVGSAHEPCCHIVCPAHNQKTLSNLVQCRKWGLLAYDTVTLDVISLTIPKAHLIETFRNDNSIDNRLSIVHYFLIHSNDMDVLSELLSSIMEKPLSLDAVSLLKEALVAGSYSITRKMLSTEALTLLRLLPLTSSNILKPTQAKVMDLSVGLSHENLWNTSMMLLSPQQRLSPYKTDIWTNIWYKLSENSQKERKRFTAEQVNEKLMFSLACYQPEALSKCSTPISPSNNATSFNDFLQEARQLYNDELPFEEIETCTATKQEHVISVNLRELTVHLVKNSATQKLGFRWLKEALFERSQAPAYVHAVASQYAAAQLELSRTLCIFVCRATGLDTRLESLRGFELIDQMTDDQLHSLFIILERYCLAVDSIAFPLPHGFSTFLTYLGYRTLPFETFVQYIENHVLELQVDVMKAIINDIEDSEQGAEKKLLLLSFQPKQRAHRLLKVWKHRTSFMIQVREYSECILSGNGVDGGVASRKSKKSKGLSKCQSDMIYDNLAPLDSFLNLLTAKATVKEFDFNLLFEATFKSMKQQKF